eukprot:GHVU01149430.1.p1 GENE.GHVU01149430.1~~GHVU01149430.1.p1  ORF type:complete len:165 (-),score=17.20 GHVU01149430.1:201-695(-)
MSKLLVPSDVTVLEERLSTGKRPLTFLERTGLMLTPPMWHFRYTKNDKNDMRRILSKSYDVTSTDPVVGVLLARQKAVHRKVVATNGTFDGAVLSTGAVWYSLRHYDYKTKLIVLPFIAYGGSFLGRAFGDFTSGRWCEYARERILGELPAKQYYGDETAQKKS